jgi:glycosyltransferase involved in cell wall biosynthesis
VELTSLVRGLGVGSHVRIEPAVGPEGIREAICWADVLVNAMVAGSGDKVVFEAASLGRAVIVSNPGFRELLEDLPLDLTFPEGDAVTLGERLRALATAEPATVRAATATVRDRVAAEHSLDHWADGILVVARGLIGRRRRR